MQTANEPQKLSSRGGLQADEGSAFRRRHRCLPPLKRLNFNHAYPALKRWAILFRPASGTRSVMVAFTFAQETNQSEQPHPKPFALRNGLVLAARIPPELNVVLTAGVHPKSGIVADCHRTNTQQIREPDFRRSYHPEHGSTKQQRTQQMRHRSAKQSHRVASAAVALAPQSIFGPARFCKESHRHPTLLATHHLDHAERFLPYRVLPETHS